VADFRLRAATADDRDALIDLRWELNLAERATVPLPRQDDLDPGRDAAALGMDQIFDRVNRLGGQILVAERDGAILGCVHWHRESASASVKPDRRPQAVLGNLSVTATARGQGIGQALIQEVEAQVKAAGIARLNLNVVAENDRALALYQAQGYGPVEIKMSKAL